MNEQEPAEIARKTVTVKLWNMEGADPIILPTYTPSYPYFSIKSCLPFFQELLGSPADDSRPVVSTYDPFTTQWQAHSVATIWMVHSAQFLLYTLLPSELHSYHRHMLNCPGLEEDIARYHQNSPATQPSYPYPLFHPANYTISNGSTTPLRQWPTDYTFNEVVTGLQGMDILRSSVPKLDLKSAYVTAFSDAQKYVPSTVRNHRHLLKKAESLGFLAVGWAGKWTDFVKYMNQMQSLHPHPGNHYTPDLQHSPTTDTSTGSQISPGIVSNIPAPIFPAIDFSFIDGVGNSSGRHSEEAEIFEEFDFASFNWEQFIN
ncbi:hypothetical protein DFH05DRAFT_1525349 [Lentinula detonsa]|uniref:Uncharacterized protein n=1 Tax=Lentinula detonsa TaxID=2804962 RepID=A0A9W8P0B4_9AGAR|nr:hypothetical protein DFH05DRAFT_1525349 [Lentinula detonsa]